MTSFRCISQCQFQCAAQPLVHVVFFIYGAVACTCVREVRFMYEIVFVTPGKGWFRFRMLLPGVPTKGAVAAV